MAVINRGACFYGNALGMAFRVADEFTFEGIGWATLPLDWTWRFEGEIVRFRILRVEDRGFPGWLYVAEADNWRWPLWWVILRGWLFLRWLERNIRMTAAIWGLIETEVGARPWWGNLWPLPVLRKWLEKKEEGSDA